MFVDFAKNMLNNKVVIIYSAPDCAQMVHIKRENKRFQILHSGYGTKCDRFKKKSLNDVYSYVYDFVNFVSKQKSVAKMPKQGVFFLFLRRFFVALATFTYSNLKLFSIYEPYCHIPGKKTTIFTLRGNFITKTLTNSDFYGKTKA